MSDLLVWDNPRLVQWGVVIGVSLAAAVIDLRSRRIPNLLTVPALVFGLAWCFMLRGTGGLLDSAAGCLVLATPYLVLMMLGGGAGDVKLMAAVGAWLGLHDGLVALFFVACSGALLALGHIMVRRVMRARAPDQGLESPVGKEAQQNIAVLPMRKKAMPYGPAIFIGLCLAALAVLGSKH